MRRDFLDDKKRGSLQILITLFIMYLATFLMLLIFAAIMFRVQLPAKAAQIGIIVIYVISGFLGGFLMGKKMKSRKFLWGIAIGLSYFAILLLVSLAVNGGAITDVVQLLVTFVLCTASAMIGGMVS